MRRFGEASMMKNTESLYGRIRQHHASIGGSALGCFGLLSARHICIFLIEVDGYSVPFHAGLLARWKALQGIMLAGHLDKWEAPVGLIGGATVHGGKELRAYTHKFLVPPCVPKFFLTFFGGERATNIAYMLKKTMNP